MGLKNNLDQIIYDRILIDIIAGKYKMGDKIFAGDIAEEFGVSKTPVTQAVKLLCNDGIFEMLQSGRIVVPELTAVDVGNICDVRILLETHAIGRLCMLDKTALDPVLDDLRTLADACRACNQEQDYIRYAQNDIQFHLTLVKGAGNPELFDLFRKAWGRNIIASYLMLPLEGRSYEHSVADHYMLINHMSAQDAVQSSALLASHARHILSLLTP